MIKKTIDASSSEPLNSEGNDSDNVLCYAMGLGNFSSVYIGAGIYKANGDSFLERVSDSDKVTITLDSDDVYYEQERPIWTDSENYSGVWKTFNVQHQIPTDSEGNGWKNSASHYFKLS